MAQEIIEAPIAGTIVSVEVAVGDAVKEDDVILYIESMKMENPILAPVAGTITEINVKAEQTVNTGDHLATIEY